jgi:hypothetical protein
MARLRGSPAAVDGRGPGSRLIALRAARRTHPPTASPRSAERIIAVGLCLAAATVLAQLACQLIDFGLFHLDLRILDSGHHKSVFGAASLVAQAAAAIAFVARAARPSPVRVAWILVGGLVAALVLVRALVKYDVRLLLPPVAVIFVLLCWLVSRDPGAVQMVVLGSLILLVCSFGLHVVGPAADAGPRDEQAWVYQLTAIVKHGSELAGWILLATGILAGAASLPVSDSDPSP